MEIKAYREGIVYLRQLEQCGCCHMNEVLEEIFRYIEVMYEDGTRSYIYEDKKGYQMFEDDFMAKRFTSFHEFFTTEELAVELRGTLKLKYYVRRPQEAYCVAGLEEKLNELDAVEKLKDRITIYGKYDKKVNYHENDG